MSHISLDFRSPKTVISTRTSECSFSGLSAEPSLHTKENFVLNPKYSVPAANTKPKILAQTAALLDPLFLCLLVTIKGRLILHDLWKLGWDNVIMGDLHVKWEKLYQDFMLLGNLEFPRQVFSDSDSADQ